MGLRKIGHFNIDVASLDESKKFYCDILGLIDGKRPPLPFPGAWLYGEDGSPMVHLSDALPADQRHSAPTGLLNHISFDCTDAEGMRSRLEESGIEFKVVVLPGLWQTQFFVNDPNGILVELIFPASETRQSDRDALAEKLDVVG